MAAGKLQKPLISHEELKEITMPAYILGLVSGIVILVFSALEIVGYFKGYYAMEVVQFGVGFITFVLLMHFSIGVLTIISSILIRKEHHCLGGSIMLLVTNVIGLVLSAGLWIGPILGIIGGILGLTEHEKLIKHHV